MVNISKFQHQIGHITDQFIKDSTCFIFMNIFMNKYIELTFLDNLKNAKTFSNLHTFHLNISTRAILDL